MNFMRKGLPSIKQRLILANLPLIILLISGALVSSAYLTKVRSIVRFQNSLITLELKVNELIRNDKEVLSADFASQHFYTSVETPNLRQHNEFRDYISNWFQEGHENVELSKIEDSAQVHLLAELAQYDSVFALLCDVQRDRGFVNYGKVGEMRSYAHVLEDSIQGLRGTKHLLSLRRREKDFLLRGDDHYLTLFKQNADSLRDYLANEASTTQGLLKLCDAYVSSFGELADLQRILGLRADQGLKKKLSQHADMLLQKVNNSNEVLNAQVAILVARARLFYAIGVALVALAGLLIVLLMSHRFSKPIQGLSKRMDQFILKNYHRNGKRFDASDSFTKETNSLARSYENMITHIRDQYQEIEQKNQELQLQYKEIKKINAELDRFVYSASHDLRSPLASLMGLVDLCKLENNEESRLLYYSYMHESLSKLDSVIHDIVDYYKNKNLDIKYERLSLRSIIEDCFKELSHLPDADIITLTLDINEKTELVTDERRIRAIFRNLISNAIRYSDPGKSRPQISISAKVSAEAARIIIQDNGLGIAQENVERVFEMFFRESTEKVGTGLGLYIVGEAIAKLGGSIRLESEKGSFTRFTLELPNHQAVEDGSSARERKASVFTV